MELLLLSILALWLGHVNSFTSSSIYSTKSCNDLNKVPHSILLGIRTSTSSCYSSQRELGRVRSLVIPAMASKAEGDISDQKWLDLIFDDTPVVRKLILEEGGGQTPLKDSTVELEYTGMLVGEKDWSAKDVVDCWLSQLQGLDHLSPLFIEHNIDGSKLMDDSIFSEEFCIKELGITNKIQAKKLVMASRRLAKQQEDHRPGTVFDSSTQRGKNYSFVLGKGKTIMAIELAVSSMKIGERARVICRSDYGYGADGLRTSKGDVMVPPFATLCFELKLVSADQ